MHIYLLWECLLDYLSIVPDKQYCIILVRALCYMKMHIVYDEHMYTCVYEDACVSYTW